MRSTLERSRGLQLLPGALWGLLGPPVTPGGPLGPPLGPPVTPEGALWGLLGPPVTPGGPFSLLNRYGGGAGLCGVGAPLGSAGKKRAAALLPVDAGPRGRRRRPRGRATAPWACPFSQHREKIGWGSLGICIVAAESCAARWGRGASGYWALWGLLGPPVTPGGPLGGLLGPPVTPGGPLGPPGASGYSRGPFSLLNRYGGGAGLCGVGAPLGSAGKKRARGRSFLSTPAREGRASAPPGVRPPPGLVPSLNIVKKSGGGLLESALWLRNRAQHVGAVAGPPVTPGALWGLLGPPVTPGGPLGPPGASGYSRGPSGASWGLRLLPGALSLPAKPIWRWCGSVPGGCAPGFGREEARSAQALLPVDAGPRGGERRRPRGGRATAPWAVPSLSTS